MFLNKIIEPNMRKNMFLIKNWSRTFCSKTPAKVDIPKNNLGKAFSAVDQKENGVIYDKKPFRLTLEAGKAYYWCLCGRSKSQPLCDGTHKDVYLKIKQRPIRFEVSETKEYWLCNCKQTKNRPFCDGSHKQTLVQDATTKV